MTDERHTPGPWAANLHHERRDGERFSCFITAPNELVPIAAVPTGVDGYGRDEGRANAHLIAAAPDLYEALNDLLDTLNLGRGGVVKAAQDALAKARGDTA